MELGYKKILTLLYVGLALVSLIAILPIQEYVYYEILRWLVSVGYISYFVISVNQDEDVFFASIACIAGVFLFRPIFPVEADKSFWVLPDLLSALYFLFIAYRVFNKEKPQPNTKNKSNIVNSESIAQKREAFRSKVDEPTLEKYRQGSYRFNPEYFDEDEIRYNKLVEALYMIAGAVVMGVIVFALYKFGSRNS